VIDEARIALRIWAEDFDKRHKGVRDPERLRWIHRDEQRAPDAKMGRLRRAMAALDFALFVTALVHYQSNDIAAAKVREVQNLTGEPMSRRHYWDRLDRVHHFIAGRIFEVEHA
jgi:hypothetical protein